MADNVDEGEFGTLTIPVEWMDDLKRAMEDRKWRPELERTGIPWSDEEEMYLCRVYRMPRVKAKHISKVLRRSIKSVYAKAISLDAEGLIEDH